MQLAFGDFSNPLKDSASLLPKCNQTPLSPKVFEMFILHISFCFLILPTYGRFIKYHSTNEELCNHVTKTQGLICYCVASIKVAAIER